MSTKVQVVLKRVAEEPRLAEAILRDARTALAPFKLSPEELRQVVSVISSRAAPPPPD
jgi:hypothetical protein